MKVYFAGSIRGGRDALPYMKIIIDFLKERGHQVLSEAEITSPSLGVGAEFEHCRLKPKLGLKRTPMLCLFKGNEDSISTIISGISPEEESFIWIKKV